MAKGLTPKQQRFVEEYLLDLNATQAAIRAGYSKKTAEVIGWQLLKKTLVCEALAKAQDKRAKRVHFIQDDVLREIKILSLSSVEHYDIDKMGNVKVAEGVPQEQMRALSSIKKKVIHRGVGENKEITYETELRLWDKPASLRMAGQHLGLFLEKVEHSGEVKVVKYPMKAKSLEEWAETAKASQGSQ